jgi:integrase
MRKKLDDAFARTAAPGIYFDTDRASPRGFLLRVTPQGARAWALNYRVKATGAERRITIGDTAAWSIKKARAQAGELRRVVDQGGDPLRQREDERAEPTVDDLIARFVAEELPSRAPRTQDDYQAMLRDWIAPALGRMKVWDVGRADVEKLHRKITAAGKLRRANAVKNLVHVLFNAAIVWGLRPQHTNPAALVKGNREDHRERYLTAAEIERLMAELARRRTRWPDQVDQIALAILTGARRGEILSMAWPDLDLDRGTWTKPAAMTKQRRGHTIPLSEAAVEVLRKRAVERVEALGGAIPLREVFRGGNTKAVASILEKRWHTIRVAAGIEDVRYHDLRHSFASLLIGAGLSLPIIGRLLGHSTVKMTERYAHLDTDPLRAATEKVATLVGRRAR